MKASTLFLSFTVALLWCIPPIAEKFVIGFVSAEVMFLILTIAYCVFALIKCFYSRKKIYEGLPQLNTKLIAILALSSLFGAVIPNLIFLKLIKNNKASIVTALTYTTPIFTFLLAYLFINEKINIETVIGICLVTIGIILIAFYNHDDAVDHEPFEGL